MMDLIWSKEYSVGIEKFDFHHRKIFSLINNLREVLDSNLSEEVDQVLQELARYSQYHLKKEEKMFDKFSYPESENHKELHALYNKKIKGFIENKKSLEINKVLDFLEKWWVNHILKEDKKYSEFFIEKGLS